MARGTNFFASRNPSLSENTRRGGVDVIKKMVFRILRTPYFSFSKCPQGRPKIRQCYLSKDKRLESPDEMDIASPSAENSMELEPDSLPEETSLESLLFVSIFMCAFSRACLIFNRSSTSSSSPSSSWSPASLRATDGKGLSTFFQEVRPRESQSTRLQRRPAGR